MSDLSQSPRLAGRSAIVTGGSRGIGQAIALALAGEGANVTVNYAHAAEAAEQVAETIRGFKMIVAGECDHLPEQAFYMVGTIDEAFEKAKKI